MTVIFVHFFVFVKNHGHDDTERHKTDADIYIKGMKFREKT